MHTISHLKLENRFFYASLIKPHFHKLSSHLVKYFVDIGILKREVNKFIVFKVHCEECDTPQLCPAVSCTGSREEFVVSSKCLRGVWAVEVRRSTKFLWIDCGEAREIRLTSTNQPALRRSSYSSNVKDRSTVFQLFKLSANRIELFLLVGFQQMCAGGAEDQISSCNTVIRLGPFVSTTAINMSAMRGVASASFTVGWLLSAASRGHRPCAGQCAPTFWRRLTT